MDTIGFSKTYIMILERITAIYVREFSEKHDLEFHGWVGDNQGTVGLFGDYHFDFDNIKRDLETNQQKNEIIEWYEYNLNINLNEIPKMINYKSWIMGFKGNKI